MSQNNDMVKIPISEPYFWMARSHDSLNRRLKMSVMSHLLLEDSLAALSEESLNHLIKRASIHWKRDFKTSDVNSQIRGAKGLVSELCIMAAYSSLDHYLNGIAAEIDRWNRHRKPGPFAISATSSEDDEYESANSKLNFWIENVPALRALMPVVRFFITIRNCVAHRSGAVSPLLERMSSTDELATALDAWPRRKGTSQPVMPEFTAHENLRLGPEHAIWASDAFLQTARQIDQFVCGTILQFDGVVSMAAYHVFISPDPVVDIKRHRTVDRAILAALTDRYKAQADRSQVIPIMRSYNLWKECSKRFNQVNLETLKGESS